MNINIVRQQGSGYHREPVAMCFEVLITVKGVGKEGTGGEVWTKCTKSGQKNMAQSKGANREGFWSMDSCGKRGLV